MTINKSTDNYVLIHRHVKPDLVIFYKDNESGKHYRASFVFSESICVLQKCNSDNEVISGWEGSSKYLALKILDDNIYITDPDLGWVPFVEASKAYRDFLAEQELLA